MPQMPILMRSKQQYMACANCSGMILLKMIMGCFALAGYKVVSFDKISSTQDLAHDMIARGDAYDHTVVVANAQYAGRGRYRRKWVSHHGNL